MSGKRILKMFKLSDRVQLTSIRYLLYSSLFACAAFSVTVARAVEMNDVLTAGERAERMGAVGVLTLGLVCCFLLLGYLIRVMCREGLKLIVENQKLLSENQQYMAQGQQVMIEVKDAILACKHSR